MARELAEIIVVDNASTPPVSELFAQLPNTLRGKIWYRRNDVDLGYGGSQQLAYARAMEAGHEVVVMLHGDGQYAPEILGQIAGPILEGKFDAFFGSRMTGDPRAGGMPWHRFLVNRLLTHIQNRLLGLCLSEFHSGYRAYAVSALRALPLSEMASGYRFDTDILIALHRQGFRIGETTIPTHYGPESQSTSWWDSLSYCWGVLRISWRARS